MQVSCSKNIFSIKSFLMNKLQYQSYRTPSLGGGLISVLIGLGVFAILAVYLMQASSNQFAIVKDLEKRGELIDLRQFIRLNLNCDNSFQTQNCHGSIDLRNAKMKKIVKKQSSMFGNYRLSASCVTSSNGAKEISISVVDKNGKSENLFKNVPLVCP